MPTTLVAGGATGIGRATVGQLRARGHNVHIADVNLPGAEQAVAEWAHLPGQASASYCDLSTPGAPGEAVRDALQLSGSLDAVVSCAALLVEKVLGELTVQEWDHTMALNLRAPFLLTQAAAPALAASEHGRIVLIGSTAAFRGGGGSFAYAASKGGVVALTRSLAVALAPHGICVNCVCPGWIDTPFNEPYWSRVGKGAESRARLEAGIPLGVQGEPGDVASVITFLLSAESRYVTGQSIIVDGGMLAS